MILEPQTLVVENCPAILLQVTRKNKGRYFEILRNTRPIRDSNYRGFSGYCLFYTTANLEIANQKMIEAKEKCEKELKRFKKVEVMKKRQNIKSFI